MRALFISSDNLIEWDEMLNVATDTYINNATVTFTLKTTAGVAVTGAENVSMAYVAASNGKYQGIIESTVDLGAAGTEYDLEITVSSSPQAFRRIRCVAQYKGAT